jgi:hypothetical protein
VTAESAHAAAESAKSTETAKSAQCTGSATAAAGFGYVTRDAE